MKAEYSVNIYQAIHELKTKSSSASEGPLLIVVALICALCHLTTLGWIVSALAICSYFTHWIAIHRIVGKMKDVEETALPSTQPTQRGQRTTLSSVSSEPRP